VECAGILSRAGANVDFVINVQNHQIRLKDFSLISVDFKPVSENGSTCSVARDQVREDLINSLQNCLGIEELLHAEILQTRERLWMGRQSDAYYDGMLVGSFRGIRRSDYAWVGVSAWRRLTRGAAQFFQYLGVSKSRTFEPLTYDNCGEILFWKRAVGRRVHNCFYKAAAN
jgi:hypothetical protein